MHLSWVKFCERRKLSYSRSQKRKSMAYFGGFGHNKVKKAEPSFQKGRKTEMFEVIVSDIKDHSP